MSKSIIAAFIGSTLFMSLALAEPSTPSVVTITPSSIKTQIAQKKIYVSPEDLASIVGRYNTDTGGILTISKLQNRIYIEAEGLAKTELTPTEQNEFIAQNSATKMTVMPNETGFSTNVVVQYALAKN